jgi:hypothetical protein
MKTKIYLLILLRNRKKEKLVMKKFMISLAWLAALIMIFWGGSTAWNTYQERKAEKEAKEAVVRADFMEKLAKAPYSIKTEEILAVLEPETRKKRNIYLKGNDFHFFRYNNRLRIYYQGRTLLNYYYNSEVPLEYTLKSSCYGEIRTKEMLREAALIYFQM